MHPCEDSQRRPDVYTSSSAHHLSWECPHWIGPACVSRVPFWCPLLVSLVSLVSWISSLVTPLLLLLFLLLLLILPLSFSPSWCRQLKPAPLVLLLLFRTAAQRTHVIIWWSGQDHLLHEPKEVSDRPKTDSCLCCDPSCPLLRIMWMQWMQWPQWLQWIHQIWKLGDWGIGGLGNRMMALTRT